MNCKHEWIATPKSWTGSYMCKHRELDLSEGAYEEIDRLTAENERLQHECDVRRADYEATLRGAKIMRDDNNRLQAENTELKQRITEISGDWLVCNQRMLVLEKELAEAKNKIAHDRLLYEEEGWYCSWLGVCCCRQERVYPLKCLS